MGSITHIVDDKEILNQYEYDAWGNVVSQKETIKNRFKFNGQQLDPITQQYYLRARFYNPIVARFTQEDTYRGDGLNLYAYCANNPVYYVDPSGHCKSNLKERITEEDKLKLSNWKFKPDDELYLKYKDVFDNSKYYDQETGNINWPKNNGFINEPTDYILQPGVKIDRYGLDTGSFVSPQGVPYEQRAVAPGTYNRPYSIFEVIEPINVKAGEIAPWFDEPGGGIQYFLPQTVKELLEQGKIKKLEIK